jgi:hypothetical protein
VTDEILLNGALPAPRFVLDYAGPLSTYSSIMAFTRSGSASFFNSAGTLSTATSDNPRMDFNPTTLVCRGFLIEEQRTNGIRNNTMQGASAGTPGTPPTNWQILGPGGITASIAAVGSEAGIPYVDIRLNGTASLKVVAFEATLQIAAASGQTWTLSTYLRQVAGSTTNITSIKLEMVGSTAGGAATADDPLSADLKGSISASNLASNGLSMTAALADATTAFLRPQITIATNASAIDITLRIGLPQLEQGAFPTSAIQTTSAAVTRAADAASIGSSNFTPWYNQTQGTLYAEAMFEAVPAAAQNIVQVDDGSNNNRALLLGGSSGVLAGIQAVGGSNTARQDGPNRSANTTYKMAYRLGASACELGVNGAIYGPVSGALASGMTTMRLGSTQGVGSLLNGWLRKVMYWPQRLTDEQLGLVTR